MTRRSRSERRRSIAPSTREPEQRAHGCEQNSQHDSAKRSLTCRRGRNETIFRMRDRSESSSGDQAGSETYQRSAPDVCKSRLPPCEAFHSCVKCHGRYGSIP